MENTKIDRLGAEKAYNHSKKAGNLGDVWKHFLLVELAQTIPSISDMFHYVESHCGGPVHELAPGGEWNKGIGNICGGASCDSAYVSFSRPWIKSSQYPAGWVFTASQLAKRFSQVDVTLFDINDEVGDMYEPLKPDHRFPDNIEVTFCKKDGFEAVKNLNEVDLVFLDPPFHPDADKDWRGLIDTCNALTSKQITFVAWYPFFSPDWPQKLVDKTGALAWESHWETDTTASGRGLIGCGMLFSDGLQPLIRKAQDRIDQMAGVMDAKVISRTISK